MVHYGLSAGLGQFFMNAPETSCLYQLGNFIFPAGQVDPDLWREYSKNIVQLTRSLSPRSPAGRSFWMIRVSWVSLLAMLLRTGQTLTQRPWRNGCAGYLQTTTFVRLIRKVMSVLLGKSGLRICRGTFPILTIFKRRVALVFQYIQERKSSLLYRQDWSIMELLRLKLLPSQATKGSAWPKSWAPR